MRKETFVGTVCCYYIYTYVSLQYFIVAVACYSYNKSARTLYGMFMSIKSA